MIYASAHDLVIVYKCSEMEDKHPFKGLPIGSKGQ